MKKLLLVFLVPFFCVGQIDYETEIQPIFDANCVSCHSNGATYTGGIELTSYDELMTGGYNTDNTNVLSTLVDYISTGYMPAWGEEPLAESEIDLIIQWIAEGANPSDNEDVVGCTDPEACNYDDSIIPGGFDDGSCEYPGDECEGFDQQLQELVYGYLEENCECALPLSIDIFLKTKKIIKVVDVLGRSVDASVKNRTLLHIYDDGSVEKKYLIK